MSESDINHSRDCILPSDGKAEGLVKASEFFALATERDALRSERSNLLGTVRFHKEQADALRARVEKLEKYVQLWRAAFRTRTTRPLAVAYEMTSDVPEGSPRIPGTTPSPTG